MWYTLSFYVIPTLALRAQSDPDLALSEQTTLNQTVQNWQSTRLQSVSSHISSDALTVSATSAISALESYTDTLVNPLIGDALKTIQDALPKTVSVPSSIVSTLNDTSDIVAATLPTMQVQFSTAAATPISFTTSNLGSYTTPGSNYATFLS